MSSLNVIDYTSSERKKTYKFEAGTFILKPPFMCLVDKVQPLAVKISELHEARTPEDVLKDNKKLSDIFIKVLKLILEETEEGKLININADNLRIDVAVEIMNDFFSQFKR